VESLTSFHGEINFSPDVPESLDISQADLGSITI
jgi:hypothetical protein